MNFNYAVEAHRRTRSMSSGSCSCVTCSITIVHSSLIERRYDAEATVQQHQPRNGYLHPLLDSLPLRHFPLVVHAAMHFMPQCCLYTLYMLRQLHSIFRSLHKIVMFLHVATSNVSVSRGVCTTVCGVGGVAATFGA